MSVLLLGPQHTSRFHPVDPATWAMEQALIDQLPRMRILLHAAFPRLEHAHDAARAQLACVHGHRNTTLLALKRLDEADVAGYVSALMPSPSSALAHAGFVKSEGNPFFMSELVRQLGDNVHAATELTVPEVAFELMRRRLAILDAAARGALRYRGDRPPLRVADVASGDRTGRATRERVAQEPIAASREQIARWA